MKIKRIAIIFFLSLLCFGSSFLLHPKEFFSFKNNNEKNNIITPPSTANNGDQIPYLWYRTWGGSDDEYGYGIAFDASGSTFITGSTQSYGVGASDAFLLKYDSDGNLQWYKTWGGSNHGDEGYGIALDASGNVFISGSTYSYGVGGRDVLLLKYDSDGNLQWYKTWGGSNTEWGTRIALDGSGNVYITGYTSSYGVGGRDVILLKYDSDGNFQWYKTWGGSDDEYGYGIALDGSGNTFITGSTQSYGVGDYDAFLLKYDSDGNFEWYKTWGGSSFDEGYGLVLDNSENIFISGSASNYESILFLKYDFDGNLQWSKTWGGYLDEFGSEIALDGSGNVYITGCTFSYGVGGRDVILLMYDSDGNLQWSETWGGSDDEIAYGLAVNTFGIAFITGWTQSYNGYDKDIFFVKYICEIDTDNDNMPDGWEVLNSLDPLVNDSLGDPDNDNLSNLEEYQNNTDPNDYDSDDDGFSDGNEVSYGTDPLNFIDNWLLRGVFISISAIAVIICYIVIRKKKHKKREREELELMERITREQLEREKLERERLERERLEKERLEKEKQLRIAKEKEILEKVRKALNVSARIKLDMMREFLEMDEMTFNKKIFDWASEFEFQIDGEYLIVNKEKISDFIDKLDKQFDTWAKEEEERSRKI